MAPDAPGPPNGPDGPDTPGAARPSGPKNGASPAPTVADRVLREAGLGSEIYGVVRRTFLLELEPRHAEAVEKVEELLVELSLAVGRSPRAEPAELAAAALTDLALTACYLDDAIDLPPRTPDEKAWQRRIAAWLLALEGLLGEMHRALGNDAAARRRARR